MESSKGMLTGLVGRMRRLLDSLRRPPVARHDDAIMGHVGSLPHRDMVTQPRAKTQDTKHFPRTIEYALYHTFHQRIVLNLPVTLTLRACPLICSCVTMKSHRS